LIVTTISTFLLNGRIEGRRKRCKRTRKRLTKKRALKNDECDYSDLGESSRAIELVRANALAKEDVQRCQTTE
jgi:hypothetical protein